MANEEPRLQGRPSTADEYVKLIDDVIVEIEEMRACIDFDVEDAGSTLTFLEPLEESLKGLRANMVAGDYQFENKDLPFMPLVNRFRSKLPCAHSLALINETHRYGLDIDSRD